MQLPTINFMGARKLAAAVSILLVLGAIASLATQQLELGLDFSGGTLIEVEYAEPAELEPIRNTLAEAGFEDAVVQHFGRSSDVMVRMPPVEDGKKVAQVADEVLVKLRAHAESDVQLRRIETVGPQVGEELRDQSGVAMVFALICMLLYVGFRFKFKFALGAVVALFHDVLLVLGLFSAFRIPFDLTVLAAVLAVIGYSLNDTIVVSDRIRENFRLLRKGEPIDIINESLNQTLSRTLVTSLTTLLVLVSLFLFGGEMIRSFSIALIFGILVGTYSSIYVASNILLATNISKEDFIEKDPEEIDDRP